MSDSLAAHKVRFKITAWRDSIYSSRVFRVRMKIQLSILVIAFRVSSPCNTPILSKWAG